MSKVKASNVVLGQEVVSEGKVTDIDRCKTGPGNIHMSFSGGKNWCISAEALVPIVDKHE